MPEGIPNVELTELVIRVAVDVPPALMVVAEVVDPVAAGADPEGPAAGVVVEGAEAICRDDICCRGAISNSAL